jgi:hypothetical protein
MGLINWIFDIYQHGKIDDARNEAAQARAEIASMRSSGGGGGVDTERLERTLGELALAVKTLQRTLVTKGVTTTGDFAQLLAEVDAEDGRRDGQAPI